MGDLRRSLLCHHANHNDSRLKPVVGSCTPAHPTGEIRPSIIAPVVHDGKHVGLPLRLRNAHTFARVVGLLWRRRPKVIHVNVAGSLREGGGRWCMDSVLAVFVDAVAVGCRRDVQRSP